MNTLENKKQTEEIKKQYNTLLSKPELSGLKLLVGINMFLLITLIVMPQYFGIHIGYDITCSRFSNIILIVYGVLQYRVLNLFLNSFMRCSITIPLILYLFVSLYTMVLRVNINAFMLVFFEILTLYMLIFAIRYVIGIKRAIKIIIGCAYFLSVYGFVEFAAGHSLMLQFLSTVPNSVADCYRSGFYRIMGPCGHPLGYGLLLILLIAISCYDYEKRIIYLYRRPVLLIMLLSNVFLTGSRSSQGVALVEIVIILLFSKGASLKKTVFYTLLFLGGLCIFLTLTFKTRIGNYILMQATTLIDHVLGTEISVRFGADITTLRNSEDYREYLPMIFQLDWLHPLLGRGVQGTFGAEFVKENGEMVYIHSIDNYYVLQYIKYAYPGLFCYVAFIITCLVTMIRKIFVNGSDLSKILMIGFCCYFINLWWVDALQTLKFVYIFIALFFAEKLWQQEKDKAENRKGTGLN
ncbi:MAG: hypothetical protein IKN95_01010 [Lachnospiraceae bacterium]|nr:hypothetical protein [Lachnospiraceae bacterium]